MSAAVAQELPALTEYEVGRLVMRDVFPARRWLGVRNVSWGFEHLPWEVDVIAVSSSGYAYEIEIKTSVPDLLRDMKKPKFSRGLTDIPCYRDLFRCRYYAMPAEVWSKAESLSPIPAPAGVIVIEERESIFRRRLAIIKRKAKTNKTAQPLTLERKYALARLGCLRQWNGNGEP